MRCDVWRRRENSAQLFCRAMGAACLGAILMAGVSGCGPATAEQKTPDEVEALRLEQEAMSQREMSNE